MTIPVESSTTYRGENSRPNRLALAIFVGAARAAGAIGALCSRGVHLGIVWTMREFVTVRPLATWLLVPYVTWVGFAMSLNFWIWRLNR